MSSREQILGRVRRALGRDGMDAVLRADIEARLAAPSPNLVPARGDKDPAARVNLFKAEAERVNADVVRVAALSDVPAAVARYLAAANLEARLVAQPTALLKDIPWSKQNAMTVGFDAPSGADAVGVSEAFVGIAETGTLILHSGPEQPVAVNFLPDTHIVVLPAQRILRAYEDAWAQLRKDGPSFMPRTVNWVTGPSRTADIEQTLLLGAHGPRRLFVVIVDEDQTAQG